MSAPGFPRISSRVSAARVEMHQLPPDAGPLEHEPLQRVALVEGMHGTILTLAFEGRPENPAAADP